MKLCRYNGWDLEDRKFECLRLNLSLIKVKTLSHDGLLLLV